MEHIIEFTQGYDCIKFECVNDSDKCIPGQGGSHGRHGLNIRFVSKGDEGAVHFLLFTGWMPQYVEESNIGSRYIPDWGGNAMAADLGYHSKKQRYEEQMQASESCEYCDGQPCYYDGSGLNASDAMYALVNGGDDALWSFLDDCYKSVFGDGEYPQPAEYLKSIRK
jgi:hypothetical protein